MFWRIIVQSILFSFFSKHLLYASYIFSVVNLDSFTSLFIGLVSSLERIKRYEEVAKTDVELGKIDVNSKQPS